MSGPHSQFLVRVRIGTGDRVDRSKLNRLIEYLGGVVTEDGFAFPTRQRRLEALEVLQRNYDRKYFVAVDSPRKSPSRGET